MKIALERGLVEYAVEPLSRPILLGLFQARAFSRFVVPVPGLLDSGDQL